MLQREVPFRSIKLQHAYSLNWLLLLPCVEKCYRQRVSERTRSEQEIYFHLFCSLIPNSFRPVCLPIITGDLREKLLLLENSWLFHSLIIYVQQFPVEWKDTQTCYFYFDKRGSFLHFLISKFVMTHVSFWIGTHNLIALWYLSAIVRWPYH